MGWPAGWVPFLIDGRPTLERVNVGCPAPDDWHAIDELDVEAFDRDRLLRCRRLDERVHRDVRAYLFGIDSRRTHALRPGRLGFQPVVPPRTIWAASARVRVREVRWE